MFSLTLWFGLFCIYIKRYVDLLRLICFKFDLFNLFDCDSLWVFWVGRLHNFFFCYFTFWMLVNFVYWVFVYFASCLLIVVFLIAFVFCLIDFYLLHFVSGCLDFVWLLVGCLYVFVGFNEIVTRFWYGCCWLLFAFWGLLLAVLFDLMFCFGLHKVGWIVWFCSLCWVILGYWLIVVWLFVALIVDLVFALFDCY